jgi:hypothetical protein
MEQRVIGQFPGRSWQMPESKPRQDSISGSALFLFLIMRLCGRCSMVSAQGAR